MKKVISFVLILVLLSAGMMVSAGAAVVDDDVVMPCLTLIDRTTLVLSFEDGVGYASAELIGMSGVTQTKIRIYVYQETSDGWDYLCGGTKTVNGTSAQHTVEFPVAEGVTYRAYAAFVATGSVRESTTGEVIETYTGG